MKDVDRKLIFETYVTEISDPQKHAWSSDREEGWGSMDWRKKAYDDGEQNNVNVVLSGCLLYTSPSPRDVEESRMPSSA